MRDVVVIGGGLSGLAACYQLEKTNLRYTLIEVKRRVGGGIQTFAERGFIMDAGPCIVRSLADEPWLAELGLSGQLCPAADNACVFRAGTESLIRALARPLQGGRLMRMAVSSVGRWRGLPRKRTSLRRRRADSGGSGAFRGANFAQSGARSGRAPRSVPLRLDLARFAGLSQRRAAAIV